MMFLHTPALVVPETAASTIEASCEAACDAALWHALAQGNREALRTAYRAHHIAVRAFAARLLGDEDVAEDLVQEVFLALPKAARSYRQECSPRSYLLGIAAKRAAKYVRTSARRRAALSRLEQHEHSPPRAPDDDAHAARLVNRLMRALDTLSAKHRLAFVLCQIEERSATEAGEILGVPASTVRARLRAAREQLQGLGAVPAREEVV